MIKSFMSKWSDAIIGELDGEVFGGSPLSHSEYLKVDEHIGESRDPKSHSHQQCPLQSPVQQSLTPEEAVSPS